MQYVISVLSLRLNEFYNFEMWNLLQEMFLSTNKSSTYVDVGLLGSNTVYTYRYITVCRNMTAIIFRAEGTVCSTEIMVSPHGSTIQRSNIFTMSHVVHMILS